jgi:hypothetical protein
MLVEDFRYMPEAELQFPIPLLAVRIIDLVSKG